MTLNVLIMILLGFYINILILKTNDDGIDVKHKDLYMNYIANQTDNIFSKSLEKKVINNRDTNIFKEIKETENLKQKKINFQKFENSKIYPKSYLFKNKIPPKFSKIFGSNNKYSINRLKDFTIEFFIYKNIQIISINQINKYILYYCQITNDIELLKFIYKFGI